MTHRLCTLLLCALLLVSCGVSSWFDYVNPFDLIVEPNFTRTLILEDGGLLMELHDFAGQC